MPTVEEYTDPHLGTYTFVPPVGPGICEVCHVAIEPQWRRCESCNLTTGQVTHPARIVVPISLYTWGGALHHVLRHYKDGRTDAIRDPLRMRASAILGRFLRDHESCISGHDPFDVITVVPSATRPHPQPLEEAVLRVRSLADRYERTLGPGPNPVTHRQASDIGLEVVSTVAGATVLLVDDTITSGAALQSAASALYLDGATDVAAVTIGRFYRPEYNAGTQAFWNAAKEHGFSFDTCCLEHDPTWVWPPP